MNNKRPEEYEIHDFLMDDRFINYHFKKNEKDLDYWQEMLGQNPHLQPIAGLAIEMLQMLSLTLPEAEFRKELQKLDESITAMKPAADQGMLKVLRGQSTRIRMRKRTWFIAAASVLVIVIGFILVKAKVKEPALLSIYNKNEKPVEFDLSDGTTIRLAPHSSLRYPIDFNEIERKVYLDGEAAFHVKRDTHHPFKVFAGDLVATVLGTIFNVIRKESDSTVFVELLKGSLKVDVNASKPAEQKTVYLSPNERVVYKRFAGVFFKEGWHPDTLKNNIAPHLLFKNADFETVAMKLKEVFGITLVNLGKKKNWNYNAEFTNAGLKEVLENICIIEGTKSNIQGDTAWLR